MKKRIREPDAVVRTDPFPGAGASGLSYRRRVAARRRALFAESPVDVMTLVVAEALRRKAQAEIRRDALRDALYEMPVSPERHTDHERDTQIRPTPFDE
ncbi:hypothetical protein CIC12_25345 [Burkholderia sp. SG-MS1]|uniref:hypothetical protein n=1 Tax=Paraburkholderia sp. SG-MS1 TaxID=2023741 RepID=UPI001446B150|nr:hypothetical protein [Paraburkholderia sp. SG-MS1]NKJ49997.1 hypothetical protein [Paraburkholderia sp. SG-MS1]